MIVPENNPRHPVQLLSTEILYSCMFQDDPEIIK